MKYIIYTEEIQRVHGEYIVTADSEEDALRKFNDGIFDDTPGGDVWGNDITDIEIEEYEN